MKVSVIGLSGLSLFLKLDHFPKIGETVLTNHLHKEYGGKGFNQAIVLGKMNVDVSFLTMVAKDAEGLKCEEVLKRYNVKKFGKYGEGQTAIGVIYTDHQGNNDVVVYEGVSKQLSINDVDDFENEIKTSDYLLIQMETSNEVLLRALELAKKYETKVILNAAPAIYSLNAEQINDLDILVVNENEARTIFKIPSSIELLDYGNYIANKYDTPIVVTIGSLGAILVEKDKVHKISAMKVKTIDTTGAGDTFIGLLTYCLLKNKSLFDACQIASFGSGMAVTKPYVIDAIPEKSLIDNLINK